LLHIWFTVIRALPRAAAKLSSSLKLRLPSLAAFFAFKEKVVLVNNLDNFWISVTKFLCHPMLSYLCNLIFFAAKTCPIISRKG
jgi:hypothetical protein